MLLNAMIKQAFFGLSLIALVGCQTAPSTPGFESRISLNSRGIDTITANEGPVRVGETSTRFQVGEGDCSTIRHTDSKSSDCSKGSVRSEYSTQKIKGEHWIHYSIYLPESFEDISRIKRGSGVYAAYTLGQIHRGGAGDTGPTLMYMLDGAGNYVANNLMMGWDQLPYAKVASREELFGQWLDVLMHINITNTIDGFIYTYVSGETTPRHIYNGPTTTVKRPRVYFKFGIYGWHLKQVYPDQTLPTNAVYWDNVGRSTSCEGATQNVTFNCTEIIEFEEARGHVPELAPCQDNPDWVCDIAYMQTEGDLEQRFACWIDARSGEEDLPTATQIKELIAFTDEVGGMGRIGADAWFLTNFFSEDTLTKHGEEIATLYSVNILQGNDDYCMALIGNT